MRLLDYRTREESLFQSIRWLLSLLVNSGEPRIELMENFLQCEYMILFFKKKILLFFYVYPLIELKLLIQHELFLAYKQCITYEGSRRRRGNQTGQSGQLY